MNPILTEQYGSLCIDVVPATNLNVNYQVELYTYRDNERHDLWKDRYDEQAVAIPHGIESAVADFIRAAKSGIVCDGHDLFHDYDFARQVAVESYEHLVFQRRFSDSTDVSNAVFHTRHAIRHGATVDIIGKKVKLEIITTIPLDSISGYPTHYLIFTAEADGETIKRDGMSLVNARRTASFTFVNNKLRFDEEEIAAVFKEELIVALGLEGKLP